MIFSTCLVHIVSYPVLRGDNFVHRAPIAVNLGESYTTEH
jgi:hypothetical protein